MPNMCKLILPLGLLIGVGRHIAMRLSIDIPSDPMKSSLKNRLRLAAIAISLIAQTAVANAPNWSEEFENNNLHLDNWRHHNLGIRFDGINIEDSVTVTNGILSIDVYRNQEGVQSGSISTQGMKTLNTGYLEVSVRFPEVTSGLKCAAWLQSPVFGDQSIDEELAPENTGSVVALFDYNASWGGAANAVVSWGDFGENSHRDFRTTPKYLNDNEFHAIGLELLPDSYVFYLDGIPFWKADKGISGVEMYFAMGCEYKKSLGEFPNDDSVRTLEVEYVRHFDSFPDVGSALGGTVVEWKDWKFTKLDRIETSNYRNDAGFIPSQKYDLEAMKVTLEEGEHYGSNAYLKLPRRTEDAWVSYCMRFSETWAAEVGGKLPGFAAFGNRFSGGYGGKPSNGKNGWSARMLYGQFNQESNSIPIGQYIYHNGAEEDNSEFGDVDWHSLDEHRLFANSARLERGRWYAIKQHMVINDANEFNGEIEVWVDERLVYRRTGLNFTNARKYREIYRFWLNVYHGGIETASDNHSIYFDQINYSIGSDSTTVNCKA